MKKFKALVYNTILFVFVFVPYFSPFFLDRWFNINHWWMYPIYSILILFVEVVIVAITAVIDGSVRAIYRKTK